MKANKSNLLIPKLPEEAFTEAEAFYRNAREILQKTPIKFGIYQKPKYVKEASAMAYLAALRAIDGYLLSRGVLPGDLPTSIREYEKALQKIPHNGKLMAALEVAYENLHILGYYWGGVGIEMIKEGFSKARFIIDALSRGSNKRWQRKPEPK